MKAPFRYPALLSICVTLTTLLAQDACAQNKTAPLHSAVFLSQSYKIDKIYRSMEGPLGKQKITLLENSPPELLWIIGYQAEVLDAEGKKVLSPEFMCHNNFDFAQKTFTPFARMNPRIRGRLMTLSQGQTEIELPKNFGIPVMSDQPLSITTQVLNHNENNIDLNVRQRTTIKYIRDRDLKKPLKALFPKHVYGMALLTGKDGYWNIDVPNKTQEHANCLPGEHAPNAGDKSLRRDQFGRSFSSHWVVPPGKQTIRTLVTKLLNLPYDTRVHLIAVHVHPFCRSLELRDMTTGKTVYKSTAKNRQGGIGLEHVDYFSSEEGVPLYKDHEYELISIYDNTSGKDQDSMAVFYMYHEYKDFQPLMQSLASAGE